jgi:hypothetical protein
VIVVLAIVVTLGALASSALAATPKAIAQQGVIKQATKSYTIMQLPGTKSSAKCDRVARVIYSCTWHAHIPWPTGSIDMFGDAKARVSRFGANVTLTNTRCYDPGAKDLGIRSVCPAGTLQ